MKLFLYILIITSLIACVTAKSDFTHGRYDAAIQKSVKKLRKKPGDFKYMDILEQSFVIIQRQDLDQINSLKSEGNPENWDQIHRIYSAIKTRQTLVKSCPSIPANITFVNVDDEMVKAKQNAAEYYYAHAQALLKNNTRNDARNAFYELQKVKSYYTTFKDVDQLLQSSKLAGTTFVNFKMENKSNMIIPAGFEAELLKMTLTNVNDEWTQFHTTALKDVDYNYLITYKLNMIDVSPEQVKETQYTENAKLDDGWDYVLDSKGNVMKDSLGNDMKVKKYKNVSCTVVENKQLKTARISGMLDFYNLDAGQLIKSDPVTADAIFEYYSAVAVGDVRALSPASKKKTQNRPAPFPSTPDLIMMGANNVKGMISNIIQTNKNLMP